MVEFLVVVSLVVDEFEEFSVVNNGSVGLEDMDLEEEDVNEVELSEEGGENGVILLVVL